ncbi:hypothetical protein CC80DRAFT_539515 [Byssothecium circinans]|uniref:F-box domain-containing protein n=1 Tax=Byssothecium circinans TaxID=147558 RepID=A0A6A5TG59_9PLEO|nr:hypothetical protein CC80DRAFT_539515 [Byssothecium circinans]
MPGGDSSNTKKRKTTRHFCPVFKMSRPALPRAETGDLDLVDELLLSIIDQIDSHDTLCKFAASCSRFQGLVEPYVWRNLFITNGEHARRVASALDNRESRTSYIHELSIRYPFDQSAGIEQLSQWIAWMDKLRHLTIESPCPNNNEFHHTTYFDEATKIDYKSLLEAAVLPRPGSPPALPMLQSLTLHGHGPDDRKFLFGKCAVMFLHPTLRRITVSCTNFDADITHNRISPIQRKSTPLQSLTLIECNVNVKFLDVVLSLPKALKELDIGERQHVFPECYPSHDSTTRTSHPLFLEALARQADSLERLAHSSGNINYISHRKADETGHGRLRDLINLQYLELGAESVLFSCLENNDYPDSLKTLKVTDAAWVNAIRTTEQILRHPGNLMRHCNDVLGRMTRPVNLDILFNTADCEAILSTIVASNQASANLPTILGGPIRKPIYQLAATLLSRNKRLRISSQKFSGGKPYIPPYMYGEEAPHEEQFYDSEDFWRLGGRNFKVMDDEDYRAEIEKSQVQICLACKNVGRDCFNAGDGKTCIHCEASEEECVYEEVV